MNWKCCPAAMALIALAWPLVSIAADEPAPALRFRRVLVREQDVDQVVRGLLPMRRDEFDRRVQHAQAAAQSGSSPARIASAHYRARLEGDSLVEGQLELDLINEGSAAAIVNLGAMDLAISAAGSAEPGAGDAQLGVDPAGKLVCLVRQSGTLKASWTRRGQRDARGQLYFEFQLPPSPLHDMVLALPADQELTAQGAIAQRIEPAADAAPEARGLVDWRLHCASPGTVALRIAKAGATRAADPLVLVKQQSAYTVHRGAIDLEASFEIDAVTEPLSRLVFDADSSLELVAVRQGESRLDWSALEADGQKRRWAVEFSPPLAAGADPVRLAATALWDGRGVKRLPGIRAVDATWQEGQITVASDDGLGLEALPQSGCRTIGYVASSPTQPTRTWQFQQLVAGAGVDVLLADQAATLTEQSSTTLEFGPTQIGGVFVAEVSTAAGSHFALSAEIPRAWIVDSIEVQPPDMLADRSLTSPKSPLPAESAQILRLALRRPLVSGRVLRLTVRAHQRRPPDDQWLPKRLHSLVTLSSVRDARRLVTWQVTDPAVQMSLAGDERLRRVDPSSLSPADMRLFDLPPKGPLFEVDQAADSLQVRLVPTSGKYRMDAVIQAAIDTTNVREEWKLRLTPEDAAISRVLVHRRPATSDLGEWRIEGEDPREITVRRLETRSDGASDAVFEITFAGPRQAPLAVTARFVRRTSEHQELGLVWSPAAAAQSGRIELHAASDVQLAIDAEGLAPAPLNGAVASPETLRGLWQYDPGRAASLSWRTTQSARSLPLAWVESLSIESACLADGTASHQALFQVHSVGQDRLVFRLPGHPITVQAEIGNASAQSLAAGTGSEYSVKISPSGNTTVRVRYSTGQATTGWLGISQVAMPIPTTSLPVLSQSWSVRLPGELVLIAPSPQGGAGSPGTLERYWTTYSVASQAEAFPSLWIARRATLVGWSLCLGLVACAAVVGWQGHLKLFTVLAAVSAAGWLVVPQALTGLPAAVFIGLTLGAAWLLILPRLRSPVLPAHRALSHSASSMLRHSTGAAALAVVIAAVCPGQVVAPPRGGDERPVVRRVIVPVNESREPVGDYVFLEPALYDALVAVTERTPFLAPDWLLSSAVYRPIVAAGTAERPLRIEEIGATFFLETFRAPTTVEFQFRRSEVHLVQRAAQLDGEPIVLAWNEDGSKLRAAIDKPGKHRLELAFGAMLKVTPEGETLEFVIPRAAGSRVELPELAQGIQVSNHHPAAAQVTQTEGGQQRVGGVELGAATTLALRWSKGGASPAAPLRTEAEQLWLWTIRPGSVAAKGKLRVRPLGGPISQLTIDLDPRLQVLPPSASGVIARQWIEAGTSTNRLHVELAQPASAEVTVPLALVMANTSGIGNFSVPRVRVVANDVKRSWHGLALAGNLEWKPPPQARADDPSPGEFAEAWGEPLAAAVLAIDADRPNLPDLRTAPSAASVAVEERLDLSVALESLHLDYVADLSGIPPDAYRHRLRVSPGLRVYTLELLSQGASVRADWTQAPDGSVMITQHEAPLAIQQIKLQARQPVPPGGPNPAVPQAEYLGAVRRDKQLRIWRSSDVRLRIAADSGYWTADPAAALGEWKEELGRLAAAYVGGPGSFDHPPTFTIEPNRPQVSGHVLTRLTPGDGSWDIQVTAVLALEQGELDSVRLMVPPQLDRALAITPAADHEIVTVSGQSSQLVVRPQRAVAQSLHLQMQGRLNLAGSLALRQAAAWMKDAGGVRHLLALPASTAGQRFEWETTGMHPLEATTLSGLDALPPGYDVYEVVAPQNSAIGHYRPTSATAPHVRRVEHRLRRTSEEQLVGQTHFFVLPRGASQLDLSLPPNCRLLHARLDGVPAQLVERGGTTWSLRNLGEEREYDIALDYVARIDPAAGADGTRRFQPPVIGGASQGEVVWDLAPSAGLALGDGKVRVSRLVTAASDWRWPAWLALALAVLCWIVGQRTAALGGLVQLMPLGTALVGAAWLAAGPWPALGWLAIALGIWLAVRWTWPRTGERPLSGFLHSARSGERPLQAR